MYTHTPNGVYVCTMKRGAPVANSRIKFTYNGGVLLPVVRVCIYMCENVHSFVSTR
jgi:hypothetical protein